MRLRPLTLALVSLLGACASEPRVHVSNVVMFNKMGEPLSPELVSTTAQNAAYKTVPHYAVMDKRAYEDYREKIFHGLRDFPLSADADGRKVRRVLIFIHGGLNSNKDALDRADRLDARIRKAGYFPIFVNWNSDLLSSYVDHIFHVHQGTYKTASPLTILFPLYLAGDAARGLIRAPVVLFYYLGNEAATVPLIRRLTKPEAESEQVLDALRAQGVASRIESAPSTGEEALSGLSWLMTFWSKIALVPVIDAGGKGSWDVMLGRTRTLFHTQEEFYSGDAIRRPSGGLSVFMRGLAEQQEDDMDDKGSPIPWEITLVGHSMGTIVVNEMIREAPCVQETTGITAHDHHDPRVPPCLRFKNVVYMAAACSLRDYEDTIFPYLSKQESWPETEKTRVYHLTLHNLAEIREQQWAVDPWMRGSLLVWIDTFLSEPATPLDRTAGRLTNLLRAWHDTPADLQDRIRIKAFGVGKAVRGAGPQRHGDFTECPFWEPDFWKPGVPVSCPGA